jgi:hypothetical protein
VPVGLGSSQNGGTLSPLKLPNAQENPLRLMVVLQLGSLLSKLSVAEVKTLCVEFVL